MRPQEMLVVAEWHALAAPLEGRLLDRCNAHADRCLAGTDTGVTSRWEALPGSDADVQTYLSQLPPDVAEKIAYKNADRLFP